MRVAHPLCQAPLHQDLAPHLLLSTADFSRLNALAGQKPWAARQRTAILQEAHDFPASYETEFGLASPEIPAEGGQWLHYYACPQTGTRLVFHPPSDHVCPDDGKVYRGYPYDQVVFMLRADALGRAALASGLAYRLGDHEAAAKAAAILKGYADRYAGYALHDNNGKQSDFGAKVYSQTLDESIWLIDMTWAYDLVRDSSALSEADRLHIERDLLRASAAVVGRANGPTDNINSWINAAVAAVGFELNDQALIHQAIDGPRGFRFQMKAFVIDGFWDEGAWGYQFYAMRALTRTAQMAKRAGLNLWQEEPSLTALFASPLGVMFPDGELPAFNDTKQTTLFQYANLYEVAFAETGNPLLGAVAAKGERNNREAFLFGREELPTGGLPAMPSQVFPKAGYATLRAADGLTDVIKFGPHGGGHGHFDKLNQVFFANGHIQGIDPGTQLYGVPTHKTWDKQTVAHNTVVVDGHSQRGATGSLLQWQVTPQFTGAMADAGPANLQTKLTRGLLLTPEYLLDVSEVRSTDGSSHTFDWLAHNFGTEQSDAEFFPTGTIGSQDGYELLTGTRVAHPSGPFSTTFTQGDGSHVRVIVPAQPLDAVYTGMAPGPDLRQSQPFLMLREKGAQARFVAVYAPSQSKAQVQSVILNGDTITIQSPEWTDTVVVTDRFVYKRQPR